MRDVRKVHQRELRHAPFELPQARVYKLLALLGHVVLSIFAQIAEGSRLLDFGGQLMGQLVLELLDIFEEFSLDVFGHRCSISAAHDNGPPDRRQGRTTALVLSIIRESFCATVAKETQIRQSRHERCGPTIPAKDA